MNIATTSKDIEIIKCRHIRNYYKYICRLTPTLWAVLVYGPDDDTLIWNNVYFSERDATYAFNHYNGENNGETD